MIRLVAHKYQQTGVQVNDMLFFSLNLRSATNNLPVDFCMLKVPERDKWAMAAGVIVAIRTERPCVPGLASGEIADLHERHGIVRLERDPRF
ncbi:MULTISPECIES: hypothetical protein [Rhizobium]|uniref:hypothetical protein n=1 Tax=Rhizobium TaxID=379 RepID=UPI0011468739|nr:MULTISPECIES: hypothetical protein [Rhizobium]MDJ1632169.1 hypothetical protein [Rhizobium rhizogenes]NTH12121.1 hypothetical protein [Rhizobium rhizogenes]NTI41437.1 hypothetical protein [Rhizobium rhizogenes]